MEMLLDKLYLYWLLFGLALIIVELFLWSMFLLWIGVSAITISIVFYLYPEVFWGLQVLCFVLFSAVSTFLANKYFPVKTVDDVLTLMLKATSEKNAQLSQVKTILSKLGWVSLCGLQKVVK